MKVSVVVPVYNPGPAIEPCLASLLGQTMPSAEVEILLVDDGSTDGTPARLADVARRNPQVHLLEIPHSGWPGRPRNVGLDAARGAYVQLVDQDDRLGPEALARLYAMGVRNGADVVLGKVASNFRGVPHGVFATDRERCTLRDAPLYDSLTPHKMFRTAFLREHSIAFPEGPRRLEDQLFMMRAYVAAQTVSILGSYPCYAYWRREDGQNAGSRPIVPEEYYANLREVLDVVVANVEPGELRDRIVRRFYRVEMLGRLDGPAVAAYDDDLLDRMVRAVRALAQTFVAPGVERGLGPVLRERSRRLLAGDADGLRDLAAATRTWRAACRLHAARWTGQANVALELDVRFDRDGPGDQGDPLRLRATGDRLVLDLGDALVDVTDDVDEVTAAVSVRHRESHVEWACPTGFRLVRVPLGEGRVALVVRASAEVAPGGGADQPRLGRGPWDVWVQLRGLGLVRKVRVGSDRDAGALTGCGPALLGSPPRAAVPYLTDPYGNLTLDVGRVKKRLAPALAGRAVARTPGRRPALRLDLVTSRRTAPAELTLVWHSVVGRVPVEVRTLTTLRAFAGRARLDLPRSVPGLPPGPARVAVLLDGGSAPALDLVAVTVEPDGRVRLDPHLPVGRDRDPLARVAGFRRRVGRVRRRVRAWVRPSPRAGAGAARSPGPPAR